MKKTFLLFIGLTFFVNNYGQVFQKAIVTDVKFLSRQTFIESRESFPNYFIDQKFTDAILVNVGNMIAKKFQTQNVEYTIPGVVEYKFGAFGDRIRLKQFSSAPNIGNIFIAVETIIQFQSMINEEIHYKLTTEVSALNGKGKKVFSFKNDIPFLVNPNDSITGPTKLSKRDFFNLYLDGLQAALDGKQKKLELRGYKKPTNDHYKEFITNSEMFYMIPGDNIYSYGRELTTLQKVLEFKYNIWRSLGGAITGNIFDNSNKLKEGYNLSNLFKNEDYIVKVTGGSSILLDVLTIEKEFKIEFIKDKQSIGSFVITDWNRIEGNFKGNNYSVILIQDFNVLEVYKQGTMIALINNPENKRTIFLAEGFTEEDLGDLFNLSFAWDFTMALKQKADSENRDN